MFVVILLLLVQLWTIVESDCGQAPLVDLTCEHHKIIAHWNYNISCDSFYHCVGDLSCTNGSSKYVPFNPQALCPKYFLLNIPMEYYYCNVSVYYLYRDFRNGLPTIASPTTLKSCAYDKIELQSNQSGTQTVGKPLEVICIVRTAQLIKSDNVSISWVGLKGVITMNKDSRITVISTISNDHIHTSTLQFLYINEEDENTSYNCTASINGNNKSISYEIGSLSFPKPTISITELKNETSGYSQLLRCDVYITNGIQSSVDIIWKTNGIEKRKITVGETSFYHMNTTSLMYTDILSINKTNNNTEFCCQAIINASLSVSANDSLIVRFNPSVISPTISSTISSTTALASSQTILSTQTTQTTQITPVSTQDTQQTTSTVAIFISSIAAFIVIGFLIAFFTVCHHKHKRLLLTMLKRIRSIRKNYNIDDDEHRIPDIEDDDYSAIGKDQPSTVEYLRIARSANNFQILKTDEESNSIISQSDLATNEEILICLNGKNSKKRHHNTSVLNNDYNTDTDMIPRKGLLSTSSDDTGNVPSGGYIQSSFSPYFEDTVALQQQNLPSCIDPYKSYTSLSDMKNNKDPQIAPTSNNDDPPTQAIEREDISDSIAMRQSTSISCIDATSVDLRSLDITTAINQNNGRQTAPYSPDAEANMIMQKPLSDFNSFPYVTLNEDPVTPISSNQLASDYIARGNTIHEKDHFSDLSYLQEISTSDIQTLDGVYIDQSFAVQHASTEDIIDTAKQTLLHKPYLNSAPDCQYVKDTSDGGYVSE